MHQKSNQEKLRIQILKTIGKYQLIDPKDKIVVGVSGGPDSICLLDNLKILKVNIVVAHLNHMIREEAKEDEQYVKKYCEKNKIEFYAKSIDVQKIAHTNKIGTEEAGRFARYEFFDEILKKTRS